ncbi:hypothetical protein [Aggregatilinea lenta]|uniref:hypothetical protein n=1 Tax=Aggregatilinea lenta TaxID=913108 RepID=UPI0013C335E9|nr:hypothetical protein [Aggregatilinea lenta]
MSSHQSRWHKWQRGQALVEYWPTLPIAIAIMLSASLITSFITNSFQQTIDGISGTGLTCVGAEETDAETEGPSYADLGGHSVQLTGYQYDPDEDVTRVSYQVTSIDKPAISHWILGLPVDLESITSIEGENKIEWGYDSTTGITGVKFDTGYNPGGKTELSPDLSGYMLVSVSARSSTETRTLFITLSGHYELTITDLGLKAGTDTYTGQIVAPVQVAPEETEDGACPSE